MKLKKKTDVNMTIVDEESEKEEEKDEFEKNEEAPKTKLTNSEIKQQVK